jgi:hypothetical protein
MCLSKAGGAMIVLKHPLMVGFGENAWRGLEEISVCKVAERMREMRFREMRGWRGQKGGVDRNKRRCEKKPKPPRWSMVNGNSAISALLMACMMV